MTVSAHGVAPITEAWRLGLTPDPALSVSEWADKHRTLSTKETAIPGRWRTSRVPYAKEIMDCLSSTSPIQRVVFMKGSQVAGTEIGTNWVGYTMHHVPSPIMCVFPTTELSKRYSKQRVDSMIEGVPDLTDIIAPARSRDSGNTVLSKEFKGGILVLTGANSAVGLRSMPVRFLYLDEVDGYPGDVEGEGSPIALAEARTRTFLRRKIFLLSSPTITGASVIEREYLASDQRRYFVPCPDCGEMQYFIFPQLRWTKGKPDTARYHCAHCDYPMEERQKPWLMSWDRAEWRPTNTDGAPYTAGFHLSSLYSTTAYTWADIARDWDKAARGEHASASAIKTFKNTVLGETYAEIGEAPEWERLLERRENYPIGTVPMQASLLVAGVDVQRDRVEMSVWAFGSRRESWLIEHIVIVGDIARDDVWDGLSEAVNRVWPHASGVDMPLRKVAIDTGDSTQIVYSFVRQQCDSRLMAIKGTHRGAALLGSPTAIDISVNGKRLRGGVQLYPVAVNIGKTELYSDLRKTPSVAEDGKSVVYPSGYVHLPMVDAEYVQQLCAEQLVPHTDRNKYTSYVWTKTRHRNESLDCRVYARAAAAALGMDRFGDMQWAALEKQLGVQTESAPIYIDTVHDVDVTVPIPKLTAPPRQRRVVRSSWMNH